MIKNQPHIRFPAGGISPPCKGGLQSWSILLLFLLLAGCIDLQRERPEKNFFTIEAVRPPDAPASQPLFPAVRLDALQVAAAYAGKPFVYRTGELQYEADYYNRFFAAPADLLGAATARWLRTAGLFAAVYDRPAPQEPALQLTGSVAALYGDYSRRPATAVLEIAFQLQDDRQTDNPVLLQRVYRRESPLRGRSPADLAAGWSTALAEILEELEGDLRRAPGTP